MSTEAIEQVKEATPKEPLFSKKNKKLITDPLDDNNPITSTGIGYLFGVGDHREDGERACHESMAVLVVMIAGSGVISAIRNMIPSRIRIIVQLVVVASFGAHWWIWY